MLDIIIQTAPKHLVRNDQFGDWIINGRILVRVLENTFSKDSEFAVAIHELVEAYLCERDGITDEQVSTFDAVFEQERKEGNHAEDAENGDDPRAPYRLQHVKATNVERAVCRVLGVNWKDHCK